MNSKYNYCPICNGAMGKRKRMGPTGNSNITVLVDECYRCNHATAIEKLTEKEAKWLARWNKRMYDDYIHKMR